jgi:hypothetical protein
MFVHTDAQLCESHVIETEALAVNALSSDTAVTPATSATASSRAASDAVEGPLSPQKSTSKAAVASVAAAAAAPQKQPPLVAIRQLWALNKPDIGWLAVGLLGATMAGVAPDLEAYLVVHFMVSCSAHTC